MSIVTIDDIHAAAARIADYVHLTPVMHSQLINARAGCDIAFKCENLQKAGAFKARGAHNAALALTAQERERGLATHSSGNHAAALALAASRLDVPAFIVMPENAPASKVAAVRAYGGQITFCESTQSAREGTLDEVCAATGAAFVPPYDHPQVIAGQGTVALELGTQLARPPHYLIAPVGGGGLLAGSALASKVLWPHTQVVGAEPAGADDAQRSFRTGQWQAQTAPDTLADGLRTALGQLNFAIIRELVDDIMAVDDAAIVAAMRLVWTRMKLLIEPSAAVGLAVVLANQDLFAGKNVVVIFSGGNVDLENLPW